MRTVPDFVRQSRGGARAGILLGALLVALTLLAAGDDAAPAQDLQEQLDAKEAQLGKVQEKEGVLTTEISGYTEKITQLEGEVATLRNREAVVEEQLAAKQAELDRAVARLERGKDRLEVLRAHLKRSLIGLREHLVTIYQSGEPDTVTVILESDGFDDLVERAEYLERLQEADENVVSRVRDLRNQTRALVDRLRATKERIEAARDAIAAKERELERTRASLQARQADLVAARGERRSALEEIEAHEQELHGHVAELQAKIQQQLLAAQGISALPAGPVQGGSGMFIWPVNGPVVSGFGMRWGSMHEGIDIAVPAGTPIRAAAGGSVVLAGPNGGYGNYSCIDHGGGLSTCYAHQSAIAVSSGSVSQGAVIGYVGCTGHCFGDHLHFEVRINGAATDPLAYL
jgi:murein DD-endopeptidase MepM/ murein hydrolase activator NlpD